MTHVVVVGGGVIGLAAAWRVAQHGAGVTVVDPTPGHGASWVAAGMLAPTTEADLGEPRLLELNQAAADVWPAFAQELTTAADTPVELRACGAVVAALDASDRRHLDEVADRLALLGLRVERLGGRDLRRRVPALAPSVRGGLDVAGDHAVDNRQVVGALRRATARAGVTPVAATVRRVVVRDGRAVGVDLADGSHLAGDVVVLAAGWATRDLAPPGVAAPVRPLRGEILRLRDPDPARPLLPRTVRGLAGGRPVYLVPRTHGEVVVGATQADLGPDTTVTAAGVRDLLRAATDLVPGVGELALEETAAGLRPGTPDNRPLVGPTTLPGLLLATGHHRHGILQAPLTAAAVAAWVAGDPVPDVLAAADPRRTSP